MSTRTALPPSTGMKSKARRVFGDAVVDDAESSLCYSPSPHKNSKFVTTGGRTSLSNEVSKTVGSIQRGNRENSGSDVARSVASSSVSCRVEKVATEPLEKENSSAPNEAVGRKSDDAFLPNSNTHRENIKERLRALRSPARRSPLRRDLVKKTQDAINKASISVNQSLSAARMAKDILHQQKYKKTAKVRRDWKENTAEAKYFNEMAEANRRELLNLQRQLSSKYSQERARHFLLHRQATLQRLEEESNFNSQVFRDLQRKLKEEKDEKRRMSVVARSKLRANHRNGALKLKLDQMREERIIFEERHEASVAIREMAKSSAQARRNSFVFCNGDARRIRQLHATMEEERLRKEHESYELKWQGEKDAKEYQDQLARDRRESLAFRNKHAHNLRMKENQERSEALHAEHLSYDLKWDGEKDAEAYHRQLAEDRRQSLEKRHRVGFQHRQQSARDRSNAIAEEHESFKLKWEGDKDAEKYKKQLEEERRQSFEFRHKDGKRQRDLEEQRRSEQMQKEHDSYELKWAGDKDAEKYKIKLAEERRLSFVGRSLEGQRQRLEAEDVRAVALANEHDSYELERAADKDVDAYKRQVERQRRESLELGNRERFQHAKVMEELAQLAREKEAESYELKWAGKNDARQYHTKLEEERRMSLQQRGKQMLHCREVERQQREQTMSQACKDEELMAAGHKDMEEYRKQCAERDRKSLEYRRKEARMQRIQAEGLHAKQAVIDDKNFGLDSLARKDVEDYVKQCKQRKRLSLAFRAKEKRHHVQWRKAQEEKERNERSQRVHDNLMDQRQAELVKQQEKARTTLNSIQHGNYSINPFAGLLK